MKILRLLALLLLLPGLAWGQARVSTAPAQPNRAGRDFIESAPQYFTPEDFGAYGDAVRVASSPFIVKNATNVFELAATYRFYGIGAITNGLRALVVTFDPASVPPFNLTTKAQGVAWSISISGVFYGNLSAYSCASNTCTFTIGSNYSGTTTTTADVTLYQNNTNPTVGNSNVETYQAITSANTTFPISDGIPQAVLTAAQKNGDIVSVNNINVSSVTLTNGFFAVALSTASSDIGSQIQIMTSAGLYKGTIIAEASNAVAYVYPRLPVVLSNTTTYAIWGPYLFDASDAVSPAKYIQMPGAGAVPSANFTGTVPLVSQIATVVDTFNVTLVTNPSASVTAAGGHLIIGHDDTQALGQAAQQCSRSRRQGQHYVYLAKNYFAATYPGSNNAGTALNSCILVGEGFLDYGMSVGNSAIQYYFHGPAPLSYGRLNTFPTTDIIPTQHFRNCNTRPSCTITFVGDSNFTQFTNGPSQSDNWEVKYCNLAIQQFAPKVMHCNYMGVGGSVWSDLDPAGPTAGIPASFANYTWYTAGQTWISQIQNGTSGATTASPVIMTGCPDVIMGKWTNNEGAAFSYGSMVNAINYTQTAAWKAACGTNPDWEVATEGEQTLGDPNVNEGVQPNNDYASLAIRGFAYACPVKLASGYCPGLIGDVSRLNHMVVDGFDPESIPMRRDDDAPPSSFPQYSFPVTWPGYVSEGLSWNTTITYAPSLGTCTWVSATTFANNLANAKCAWGQWSNEMDFKIGNPNGAQSGSNPGVGATIDYPGNQVRLIFNQVDNSTTGSLAGMIDYEIDTWRFGITATGTSGTNTLACASACVSVTKHIASTVINANIPTGCHISAINSAGTSITLQNADGTACNLTGNITSSANNVTVAMIQIPQTSSGQYGFACITTTGGANLIQYLTIWEFRGTSLHISGCGNAGPNWVDAKVVRFGNQFQPTLSTPAGSPSGLTMRYTSAGVCCGSSSMVARPEYPQYVASLAGKDVYGWCLPASPTVAAIPAIGLGQCATHKSTFGSKIEDMTMTLLQMAAATGTNASQQISFQPGLITSISNTKGAFSKFSKASTVANIIGSANSFTCAVNPTVTLYECGTDANCASPTTIGSVTVTASGVRTDGTISSAGIIAGDSVAWAISAGTCTALDINVSAQINTN